MKKTLFNKSFTINLGVFYMKIIATIIPKDLGIDSLLSCFCPFLQTKNKIKFSGSWWSGNKKYFCFLFRASCAPLQSHVEFSRLLLRNFLTCYSCSYYSSIVWPTHTLQSMYDPLVDTSNYRVNRS